MDQMVSKIDNQTVPLLNASMATQLNHMTDLTNALTSHLNEILKKRVTQIDRDTAARLNQLQSMARATLNQAQGMIQADIELVSNSVIKVWKQTDATVIKLINQWFYDALRFASLFLFLIGLLLLGLRLFRFLEKRIAFTHLFRHSFILALISFVVIGIFLKTNIPTFHHSIIPFPGKIRKPQKTYIFSVGCRNSETFNYYRSISYHT